MNPNCELNQVHANSVSMNGVLKNKYCKACMKKQVIYNIPQDMTLQWSWHTYLA